MHEIDFPEYLILIFDFIMLSRADVILFRLLFEPEERRGTEEVLVHFLEGKLCVWRLIETSDITPGFLYRVSRILKISV